MDVVGTNQVGCSRQTPLDRIHLWFSESTLVDPWEKNPLLDMGWLEVGGWTNPSEKCESKWESPQKIGVKIKHIWVATI